LYCSTTFSSISLVTHTTGMTHFKVLFYKNENYNGCFQQNVGNKEAPEITSYSIFLVCQTSKNPSTCTATSQSWQWYTLPLRLLRLLQTTHHLVCTHIFAVVYIILQKWNSFSFCTTLPPPWWPDNLRCA